MFSLQYILHRLSPVRMYFWIGWEQHAKHSKQASSLKWLWEDYHVSAGNFCDCYVSAGNLCDYHVFAGNLCDCHMSAGNFCDYHVFAGNLCDCHMSAGNFCDCHMSAGNFCTRLWNARGMWLATNYCDKRLRGQKVSNLGIPPQKQLVLVDLGGPRHGPCFFQFHGVLMKNAQIISWCPPWQILYLRLFAHWITNDIWMLHLCE